jgi:hypothetical protein
MNSVRIKIAVYVSLGVQATGKAFRPHKKHIQNIKFLHFFIFVRNFFRIRIPIADPDPADQSHCEFTWIQNTA